MLQGNTAVYMLYANARVRSILRHPAIAEAGIDLDELCQSHTLKLSHPKVLAFASGGWLWSENLNDDIIDIIYIILLQLP